MREALRDIKLGMVLTRQHHADPLAKVRRAEADVHGDIENLTPRDPAELGLRVAKLIMQPAQHPARGMGMIVLHERLANSRLGESVLAVGLHEEAARIFEDPRLDEEYSGK